MIYKINKQSVEIFNEDCFDRLQQIPDNSVQCCITDPPYAIGFGNSHSEEEFKWDNQTSEEYVDFTSRWLNEVYRILKPNGTCWMFFGPTKIHEVFDAISKTKFINNLENWMIMARNKGRGAKTKLKSLREDVFHLTKTNDYLWNTAEWKRRVIAPYCLSDGQKRGWDFEDGIPKRWTGVGNLCAFSDYVVAPGFKTRGWVPDIHSGEPIPFSGEPSDVVFFTPPSYHSKFEKQIHSCQKSILLLTMLTMISSNYNDTILDPFMGSGASGVAAAISDRSYIGIEREKETFEKATDWLTHINYKESQAYLSDRISTSEPGKFSFGMRSFMPK